MIGRPSILVPYPHALDHDQTLNARAMAQVGAARVVEQIELGPKRLAAIIRDAMADPQGLALLAENAKKTGKPDAAGHLADCVEDIIAGRQSTGPREKAS